MEEEDLWISFQSERCSTTPNLNIHPLLYSSCTECNYGFTQCVINILQRDLRMYPKAGFTLQSHDDGAKEKDNWCPKFELMIIHMRNPSKNWRLLDFYRVLEFLFSLWSQVELSQSLLPIRHADIIPEHYNGHSHKVQLSLRPTSPPLFVLFSPTKLSSLSLALSRQITTLKEYCFVHYCAIGNKFVPICITKPLLRPTPPPHRLTSDYWYCRCVARNNGKRTQQQRRWKLLGYYKNYSHHQFPQPRPPCHRVLFHCSFIKIKMNRIDIDKVRLPSPIYSRHSHTRDKERHNGREYNCWIPARWQRRAMLVVMEFPVFISPIYQQQR